MTFKTAAEIATAPTAEFILLVAHAGSGKTHAICTLAEYWELEHGTEDGRVFLIDNEDGARKIIREQFPDVENLYVDVVYDSSETINALLALEDKKLTNNDWICLDSIARDWENGQDTAYLEIAGTTKSEYMHRWVQETGGKAKKGAPSVIPDPSTFWIIAKDAHVRSVIKKLDAFHRKGVNILCTTTLPAQKGKTPKTELKGTRKEVAQYLGIDVAPDGAPGNPRIFDTVVLMGIAEQAFWAMRLKDRGYSSVLNQKQFKVNGSTGLYMDVLRDRSGNK